VIGLDFDEKGITGLKSKYAGSKHLFFAVDVTKSQSLQEVQRQLAAANVVSLDAVLNIAGVLQVGALADMPEQGFVSTISVALFGAFLTTKTFFPLLLAGKGRVVNMSSEVAHTSYQPFNIPYQISKVAVEGYSCGLRGELWKLGIRVVVVAPGAVNTSLIGEITSNVDKAVQASVYFKDDLRCLSSSSKQYGDLYGIAPEKVADVFFHAVHAEYPRYRYRVNNSLVFRIFAWIPAPLAQIAQVYMAPIISKLSTRNKGD